MCIRDSCIGNAYDLIRHGQQEIVFAGGGEETHWTMSILFDAMGALSSKYNETPEVASRAYDADRDGFVIGGGAGVLVVESLDSAKSRGASIIAEIQGFGQTSDGHDMVQPSGEGAVRCMQMATQGRPVDYINAHGTSTPLGDIAETIALKSVFGKSVPQISSTKSMTGHTLGAAGAIESIFCIKAINEGIIPPTINLDNPDPLCDLNYTPLVSNEKKVSVAMNNSFGFGGTNSTLVFKNI